MGTGVIPQGAVTVGSTVYNYDHFIPSGPAPSNGFPLIVAMHGTGGDATAMTAQFRGLAEQNRFAILSPSYFDNNTYFDAAGDQAIFAMIDELEAMAPLNRDRIYTTGFSTGGSWSFQFALLYPNRVAAASVVAGGYSGQDTSLVDFATRPVPFYLSHGVNDNLFPISVPRSQKAAMDRQGFPAQLDEHGFGHGIPPGVENAIWNFVSGFSL